MGINKEILKNINKEILKQGGSARHDDYEFNKDVLLDILKNLEDISGDVGLKIEIVETLPDTGVATTIYLIPNEGSKPNIYDEYMYIANDWEKIGSTEIDLSKYYNKTETNNLLNGKVNKVTGKDLSTNDYTTAEKTKLSGLSDKYGFSKTPTYSITFTQGNSVNLSMDSGMYLIKIDVICGIVVGITGSDYKILYSHPACSISSYDKRGITITSGYSGTANFYKIA